MPFDPTDPRYASPLASAAQDRMTGMLNQPQMKAFAPAPQDSGTTTGSPILPAQMQVNRTMGMALGGAVNDDLAGIKDTIRAEFAKRGLDFDRFVQNPAVMDEVGKSIQSQGQSGDTILAHINPEEAKVLKERGGSGTINPATGLPQFAEDSSSSNQSPSYTSSGGSLGPRGPITSSGQSSGYTPSGGGGGGGGGSLGPRGPITSSGQSSGYKPSGGGGVPSIGGGGNSVSPLGGGRGSISLGEGGAEASQGTGSVPTFAGVDPMSGLPIGGASDLSSLGQLATAPTLAPSLGAAAPAAAPSVNLSDINFTDMNAGVAPNAVMPGGISNFAASPINPGYTDTGVTAMRMAANQPGGEGYRSQSTEFNLGKLGEFDPVAQTQAANILNQMMDKGYAPGFDPYGVGRTMAQQAALYNAAGGNLTAPPGQSMHNFGLAMDVENLSDQGYRDLANIAKQEGWGWGGSQDPAHVQMAPWGAGAMQTAQRLGASPFAGTQVAAATSPLKNALNTVSNIANELFGVKSAAAQTQENTELDNLFKATEMFGGAEPMSPFVGSDVANMAFPPQSQQQMLDALGISGQPVPAAPTQQQVLDALGIRGPIDTSGLPAGAKYQGRAPGAVQQAIDLSGTASPANVFPISQFGYPEQMATYGAAVGLPAITPALTSFDMSGGVGPAIETAAQTTDAMDLAGLPIGRYGVFNMPNAIQQYREALNGVTVPSGTILGNVTAGPYVNNPQSEYYQTDAQMAETIMNNLPLAGLTVNSEGMIVGPNGEMATPEQMANVMQLASRQYTVPQSQMIEGSTGQITLDPTQFVNVQNVPMPTPRPADTFGAIAPQGTGLTGFESALSAPSVAAAAPDYSSVRAEVPSTGDRMTSEELKSMGIYKDTLQPGETVRQDFNSAYADATKRGIDTFEWTNPATGATGLYKSGADRADLAAEGAKPASGAEAPKTDYEKRVAELEAADMIANGMTKEEYAEAMGVPVSEVKTRTTTQFGAPMAEYYTKTVLESLAGMSGGKSNMEGLANLISMFSPLGILGIAGKNIYNQYKKNSVQKAEGGKVENMQSPLNILANNNATEQPIQMGPGFPGGPPLIPPGQLIAPQIQLPQIALEKFAAPYTGVSPDYKPPVIAPPPPAPTPEQKPEDWLKSKFPDLKGLPRGMSAWRSWFENNLSGAPQNIQDWYKTLPTDKKGFLSALPTVKNFGSFLSGRLSDKNKGKTPLAEYVARTRQPMPSTSGGYGGEYLYFAEGGTVSPLNAMGKK